MPKNKSVIFCRVSSKEQEDTGYSLPAQEKLLREYAGRKQLSVSKVFAISESASGAKQRKEFLKMIEYLRKSSTNILAVEKVDRLNRDLKSALVVNEWLDEDDQRQVHFVKQNLVISRDAKSDEKFRWDIEIVLAKKYIANLSEEVKKGQKEKISQGWLPTKPPLGYKTTGEKGHKIHIIDKAIASHIKKMFEWYAMGNYSLARLESELYKAGLRSRSGKKLGISRIHILLSDPFYYGEFRWKEKIYPGKQEPLISRDLFNKVQGLLKRKTQNPYFRKHNPLFKGRIYCEHCGGLVTWYLKKGRWYGHCSNHGEYRKCARKTCVRQDRIEEQLTDFFEVIAPKNKEVLDWIEGIIRQEYAEKVDDREREVQKLNKLLASVRKQKDKYFEAKINREVPLEYCERKIAESTHEEEALESALIKVGDQSDEYQKLRLAIHELAYKSSEIYEKATNEEKQLLFSQIFTNLLQNRYEIKPEYTFAAQYLANWMPRLNRDYELQKSLTTKGKTPAFADVNPVMLRGWDSNPQPFRYTYLYVSIKRGLSHHPTAGCRALMQGYCWDSLASLYTFPDTKYPSGLGSGLPFRI